ncbi:MAG TPA: hypothetical protein VK546_05310 [Gaiellales bacterium]|nr:hypothetical protein [Gaiellales bacterium]
MRRPAPATVIATIALVFAVASVGEAASGWVKRALYARNAGSVDGIRASRTPHKGKLIALPASGKLPMSILPASVKGARGPAGPAGSNGTDGSGGSVLVATAGSAVNVGTAQTAVVTLQLKAGSYALVAKASLHATLDTSTPGVTCLLRAGSDGDQADADLSSSSDDPVALIATHTFAAAGAATLTCAADDSGVVASDARIIALRVTALTPS